MTATVIVTGGAGFIGSWVTRLLLERGHRVVVVDNLEAPGSAEEAERLRGLGAAIVEADVAEPEALSHGLRAALRGEKPAALIHLAAVVSLEAASRSPRRALRVNVEGTLNAALEASSLGATRFVYASSAAVYGEPLQVPIPETHPTQPQSLYGETKLAGERLLATTAPRLRLHTVALRFFNVYGPGMRPGPYAGVVLRFAEAILHGETPTIYGDGNQTRDFIHVADVAEAAIAALATPYTGPLNIGTGRETSINQLYRLTCTAAKQEGLADSCPKPRHAPPRPGDVRRSAADTRLARAALNWAPRRSLEEGLRETLRWLAARRGDVDA